MTTLFFHLVVARVEERSEIVRGHKNPDGSTHIDRRSTGWWIIFTNGMSFGVGEQEPDFSSNDKVILALRKYPDGNSLQSSRNPNPNTPEDNPGEPTSDAEPPER